MRVLLIICIFFLLPHLCSAQLCNGSLGDPVVKIDFGTNASQPLPFALTNYSYVAKDCPDDGYYTITTSTSDCFNRTWHNLNEDHTADDIGGKMMLINASYEPGDFYLDKVQGLCAGTTYEFAAWIVNVLRPAACGGNGNKPNITFSVEKTDGTVLQSVNTGDINATPGPIWKQYGFFFTMPADVQEIVVRMKNNAAGGCGNDLALDDITFRPCGPMVHASVLGISSDTVDFCEGTNKQYTITGTVSAGYNNPEQQWQISKDTGKTWTDITGETKSTLNVQFDANTEASKFLYRLSVAEKSNFGIASCRVVSNEINININPIPVTGLTSNSPVCSGNNLLLHASNGATFQWTGPNNFSASDSSVVIPDVSDKNEGKYVVTVTSVKGCMKTDSVIIIVNPSPEATVSDDVTICEGAKTKLSAFGGGSYVWFPSNGLSSSTASNPDASPSETTLYKVRVSNAYNCYDTAQIQVKVLEKPEADAGPDKRIFNGESTNLDGTAKGANITYYWTPNIYINNSNVLNPVVTPPRDTTYTLHVQSMAGCGFADDEVFVRVYQKITVPNAFSPNGDGINDVWKIDAIETYPKADIFIFNRYGQLVAKRKSDWSAWDGTVDKKPVPAGTYYYVIDLKEAYPKLTGWLFIVR